jgi:sugar lactone lactonase YvrE
VGRDGGLYYGRRFSGEDGVAPGLTRFSPGGERTTFAPALNETFGRLGITGLASGPDGSLYVASSSALVKVNADGTSTTLAHPVVVSDCDEDLPFDNPSPYLRGLDVDRHGVVYAAATGCHRVVKITPEGKVETVLKAERPWSPTGVAVHGEDVYVVEYTHANAGPDRGWLPRVRKLGRDGKVAVLATVPRGP